MLHSSSRTMTVIDVDMDGYGGLAALIRDCYDLQAKWSCRIARLGDHHMFEVSQENDSSDLIYSEELLMQNYGEDWDDLQIVLMRLCADGFLPYGIYLVHW